MIQEINKQIEAINKSLAWIRKNKSEQYDQKFIPLIECRKELKKIAAAAINNPGIAAFGKSQVGKSYLISCLLQDNGKPFMVKAGSEQYNFVKDINPPSEEGGGRESTGVVSRFSSFKRRPEAYSQDLPVMVNTFSLTDVILILADSYYNEDTQSEYTFGRGVMPYALENAAFSLGIGEVSDIIKTEYGYHIIKCRSTFNKEETEKNKLAIINKTRQDSFNALYDEFVTGLKSNLNEPLWKSISYEKTDDINTTGFFDIYDSYFTVIHDEHAPSSKDL